MRKANFACGYDVIDGYENYDINPCNDNVKYLDLNDLPLTFDNDTFDEILMSHIIEHLDNPYMLTLEIHRILKPNGVAKIHLPANHMNLQHLRSSHNKHYFHCLSDRANKINPAILPMFNVKVKGVTNFKQLYRQWRDWLQNLIRTEWTYELRKL